jgi:hypothetical protein
MSGDIILITYMSRSLLDLNKNKYGIINIYPSPQGHIANGGTKTMISLTVVLKEPQMDIDTILERKDVHLTMI